MAKKKRYLVNYTFLVETTRSKKKLTDLADNLGMEIQCKLGWEQIDLGDITIEDPESMGI